MGVSDNTRGLILAMLSSLFIGTSFILKKKGLHRAAAAGTRAGGGGYTYLLEPLWWAGMITMIVGEVANFVAYIYAPAVLVTPLGALSIIVSYIIRSARAHVAFGASLWADKYTGLPGNLFLDGCAYVICVVTQLNYLNKALDTFSAAIVSPIYYVMFTTLTIVASAIMFKVTPALIFLKL
ncbi:probable magnesium transporter nipa6 [Phtheirospermum japonicum]|uniref:Probable magnesium transporter n=1 Tax=Phtheirospermum japonicum TaxID=374723 RepID=A0A830BN77_9LAMI|nr:probable magnesium transporter nipa6 [Phtheirospermum japonicum]